MTKRGEGFVCEHMSPEKLQGSETFPHLELPILAVLSGALVEPECESAGRELKPRGAKVVEMLLPLPMTWRLIGPPNSQSPPFQHRFLPVHSQNVERIGL